MPKIDVSLKDLEDLVGRKLSRKESELEEALRPALAEVEEIEGNEAELEIKGSNRPDLWSVEGVARQVRYALGIESGLKKYETEGSGFKARAHKSIKNKRPYLACAVIKEVNLNEKILKSLIQTQEKIDGTFGRSRKKTSIGLYNYDLIEGPIEYKAVDPTEYSFVPLEFEEELNLEEILKKHPKGQEYGHIISKYKRYPILIDSEGKILSMPPIINSNDLGKVTPETENILIEVTGTDAQAVKTVVQILSTVFAERGGKMETAEISYDFKEDEETPDFSSKKMEVDPESARNLLGLEISNEEIVGLLEEYGYNAEVKDRVVEVTYPSYRADLMHKFDLIEDVAIAFGYNNFEPEEPKLATEGGISSEERFMDDSREAMIDIGFQEILSFTLTNPVNLTQKMNQDKQKSIIEVSNPISENWCVLRNSILPSLLEFLSENKHRSFPQKIFEAGNIFKKEGNEVRTKKLLGAVISKDRVNYSEMASILEAFLSYFGLELGLEETQHKSFLDRRCAKVLLEGEGVGLVGEIHPRVLENWKLEKPVVAFELNLEKLKTASSS